jgi:hypothetical protein
MTFPGVIFLLPSMRGQNRNPFSSRSTCAVKSAANSSLPQRSWYTRSLWSCVSVPPASWLIRNGALEEHKVGILVLPLDRLIPHGITTVIPYCLGVVWLVAYGCK